MKIWSKNDMACVDVFGEKGLSMEDITRLAWRRCLPPFLRCHI